MVLALDIVCMLMESKCIREKSSASQVTTSIPLNHWMRSGENDLKLASLS